MWNKQAFYIIKTYMDKLVNKKKKAKSYTILFLH